MADKQQDYQGTLNRSFARRKGKGLTLAKQQLLETILPQYLFSEEKADALISANKVIMEIGFGMGDHLVQQMQLHPQATFLGAEVYMNGVAQFLELGVKAGVIPNKNESVRDNLLLWPDDVDLLFEKIPNNSIDIIYILFPDPWPKRKQNKKRLVNRQRLDIIKTKLKKGGMLIFATDIDEYFDATYELINKDSDLSFVDEDFSTPHEGYVITKYNKKALREGRSARFMRII